MSKDMKTSLTDIHFAAETLCINVDARRAVDVFKDLYVLALRDQFIRPRSKEFELKRSVWLDIMKWSVGYRVSMLRKMRTHLWTVIEMLIDSSVNPWCNLVMTFGGDCESCPLTVFEAVPFENSTKMLAEASFLKCDLRNPNHIQLREAVGARDVDGFSKIIRREIEKSRAVKVFHGYEDNPERWS